MVTATKNELAWCDNLGTVLKELTTNKNRSKSGINIHIIECEKCPVDGSWLKSLCGTIVYFYPIDASCDDGRICSACLKQYKDMRGCDHESHVFAVLG
jgi:hypothetical protein